jgi:uncharacterized protein (DUF2252 family)
MEISESSDTANPSPIAASLPPPEPLQTDTGKASKRVPARRAANLHPASSDRREPAHLTVAERQARGRAQREQVPRETHADWVPPADRPDPINLLQSQEKTRLPDLLPLRYHRMLASPLAFLRGSAIIMAHDLGHTPKSGIQAQLCGDCHLSNFGVYGSPERALLFDLNDFDETLPGPWEWDVKRLAASLVVAGRSNGFSTSECREAARKAVQTYRLQMRNFAQMSTLAVWYSAINAYDILQFFTSTMARARKRTRKTLEKARSQDHVKAFSQLTEVVNGRRQIKHDPPLVTRLPVEDLEERIAPIFQTYRRTLRDDKRALLDQYHFVDAAHKVVGVGSVGRRCYIVLLEGRDEQDPLFLQLKEAERSALEMHLPKSVYQHQGQRVVAGQRLMQAESDIFLGWLSGEAGADFYCRQLKDMKGSIPIEETRPAGLRFYASVCGWTLARAHARSGDRIQIAAYLGKSDAFDQAIVQFAEVYATQTERDYQALLAAVKAGKIVAASS